MATINVATGTVVVAGTTSADTITLADAIAANSIDGNGGPDTLILDNAADDFATLTGVALTYDEATDTWTVSGASLTEGFTSVTTADGITIEAGVESSGTIDPAAVASGSAAPLNAINDYEWDGAASSVTAFTLDSIVSVDGQDIATVGSNFVNSDGAFSVSATGVTFTANTAAIAAQGNVGDTATFSYTAVIANSDGDTREVTITFTADVPFTTGNDTAVADAAGEAIDETAVGIEDAGDDTFNGAEGNDTLTAGAGNDTLLGANGDDVLVGGADDDFLRGGNGADTISAASGENNLGGGAGIDSITGGSDDDTIFGGVGDDVLLDGGAGNDVINGGSGADTLTGSAGDDTLRGGDGDDVLNGTSGSNELRGGAGDDTVNGGTDDDLIFVSLGDDSLTGGTGDDTFVLRDDSGTTTIADFGDGADQLDVSNIGIESLDDVLAIAFETGTGAAATVTLAIDEDTSVVLGSATGVTLADLSNADFDFA